MKLDGSNYYSVEANKEYCSASQYKALIGCPIKPACEERAIKELNGEWVAEPSKALLMGSILDALWENDDPQYIADKFPNCVSTRGPTKGQLKSEYLQVIEIYKRTLKDQMFCKLMSGEKQTIMTGSIEGLPFKIKMDSYVPDVCITDLKSTQDTDMDFRIHIPDTGHRVPFYEAYGYVHQLAIYREIVRQNTGKTLRCYIAAVDKKPHPRPVTLEIEQSKLDKALDEIKGNCSKVIMLKSGEIKMLGRCERCDYCRDTYECKIMSTSEFEAHDE